MDTPALQNHALPSTPKSWMNRLNVGQKITLGYVTTLGVAIAGTAGGVSIGNCHQNRAIERQNYSRTEAALLLQLQASVLQSRTHQQQLIPLSEFPDDFRDEYGHILKHAKTIQSTWDEIEAFLAESGQKNVAGHSEANVARFVQTYDKVPTSYLRTLDSLVTEIDPSSLNTPVKVAAAQQQLLAFTNGSLALRFDGISDDLDGLINEANAEYLDSPKFFSKFS